MIRNTIYTFGADENKREVRYLPANSKDWIVCKTEIPSFFIQGCAVAIKSKGEIWLIGGVGKSSKQILSFDLQTHTFKELPMKLNIGRSCHRCIFTKIENSEVILVTGGIIFDGSYVYDNSVEIINVQTHSSPNSRA